MGSAVEAVDESGLRWNRGGWLGAQLGSTLWLAILGVALLPRDAVAGAVALACFAIPNVAGWVLWRRRARLDARRALLGLMTIIALCALAGTVAVDLRGIDRLPGTGNVGVGALYWALLVYPLVVLTLWARGSRRAVRTDATR